MSAALANNLISEIAFFEYQVKTLPIIHTLRMIFIHFFII